MVKVNLENPFLARPKNVKIGRSYWQAQSKAPTILKQKNTWVKQQNDRNAKNYKAFRRYLQTEGARALNREVKDYLTTSNDNTWTSANRNPKNQHLQARVTKGAKAHASWEKEHPTLTKWGNVLGAAPFAVAAAPLAAAAGSGIAALGDAAAATSIGQGVTNFLAPIASTSIGGASIPQWLDTGLTSAFGAHGIQTAIDKGEISPTTALEIAPLGRLAKPMFNKTAMAVENYRYPIGRPQVPENFLTIKPQIRTRVGDVEIDNPNLLYHLDRGNGAGAFSTQGAYVEDGILFPGVAKKEGQLGYSWWNKGKPYATSVKGQPMTRLMTTTEDTPGMLHVRSQNYPIGQWNGKRGLVTKNEYVTNEPVDVSNSTYVFKPNYGWKRVFTEEAPTIEWRDAASTTPKVNWDADNWFKTISGRNSYSSEEAAELASNVPEYRAIEQRLFDEGKLALNSNGNAIVVGSKMTPQEYIMRQSKAFQKMNPEHHYVGVSKSLRNSFENESRDPATKNRYEVWTDRKSPKNVEEYAESQQGGTTTDSHIKNLQDDMTIREENYNLHQEQLKWKYEHGKISKDDYNQNLKSLKDNYDKKQNEARKELDVLVQRKQKYPLNGGKVFDVTYPKETIETPIINAENNHWGNIPFDNVVRDAPNVVTHYKQRPYSDKLQTDQIISAARRNGYGVTHIDNVMDTYNGELLNETIIGRDTPVKSVLGNTGNFDINTSNKWKLYRSLVSPFLGLGTLGSIYKTNKKALGGSIPFYNPKRIYK